MFSKKHQESKLVLITSNIRNVRHKWVLNIFLILVLTFLSSCSDKDNTYSNLTVSKNLSEQEQQIEQNFIKYLQNDPQGAIALYRKTFPKIIDTDKARELSEDYNPQNVSKDANIIARSKWSSAVFKPAGTLAFEVYKEALEEGPSTPDSYIVFMAGGAGSGKTTSTDSHPKTKRVKDGAQFIYDTTLSNEIASRERIRMAIVKGFKVRIIYVYRDPIQSFVNGALSRANDEGRTMSLDGFINTHINAPKSLVSIMNTYGNGDIVKAQVLDNNYGKRNSKLRDLEFFQNLDSISREKLKKALLKILEKSHNNGQTSDIVFKAFNR
ncbi:MAG: hypothetical protein COA81_07420 [Alphaproteobacteria bacterium]|nr:MAG: hypothetical protein COA81_07420 [Alphaproteobacteria bacterium]